MPVIPSAARNLLFVALAAPALAAQSSPTMEPTNGAPSGGTYVAFALP